MPVVVLTTPGSGTWSIPGDYLTGTPLTIELWGSGSGGGGRSSGSAFGSGGGGGAYSKSTYYVTTNDLVSGIPYTIGAGGNGGNGGDGGTGHNSTWSTNNTNIIPNSLMTGAALPSTQPAGWAINATNPAMTIAGLGTVSGIPYIDINFSGSTGSSVHFYITFSALIAAISSTVYTLSAYCQLIAGSLTGITSVSLIYYSYTGGTFSSNPLSLPMTLTGTLTRFVGTATSDGAFPQQVSPSIYFVCPTSTTVNFTIRVAGVQMEQASSASAWKSTPGFFLANGASNPSNTVGGPGGLASSSTGTLLTYSGGSGANYNTAGTGGGGSAGPDGAGAVGTTAGVGGQADNGLGGLGGPVSSTTPGVPGASNVVGGGGGGGLGTVNGTAGAGGFPGGGGGGSVIYSGAAYAIGGAGADGQVRITYTSSLAVSRIIGGHVGGSGGII